MNPFLTLEVETAEDGISFRLSSADTSGPIEHEEWQPIDAHEMSVIRRKHDELLRSACTPGFADSSKKTGQFLYRTLIPARIGNSLRAHKGSLLVRTKTSGIPWESLYDGDDFWGLRFAMARRLIVKGSAPPLPKTNPSTASLRALVIGSDPDHNIPSVQPEVEQISTMLESFANVGVTVLTPQMATRNNVVDALQEDFDLIHYAGHVVTRGKGDSAKASLLLAGKQPLSANLLKRNVSGHPLVFINGCVSAAVPTLGRWDEHFGSIADVFFQGGAVGVVGTISNVSDTHAAALATEFYRHVFNVLPIGAALRGAREDFRRQYPDSPAWLSFVFYGNPTHVLLSQPIKKRTDRNVRAAESQHGGGSETDENARANESQHGGGSETDENARAKGSQHAARRETVGENDERHDREKADSSPKPPEPKVSTRPPLFDRSGTFTTGAIDAAMSDFLARARAEALGRSEDCIAPLDLVAALVETPEYLNLIGDSDRKWAQALQKAIRRRLGSKRPGPMPKSAVGHSHFSQEALEIVESLKYAVGERAISVEDFGQALSSGKLPHLPQAVAEIQSHFSGGSEVGDRAAPTGAEARSPNPRQSVKLFDPFGQLIVEAATESVSSALQNALLDARLMGDTPVGATHVFVSLLCSVEGIRRMGVPRGERDAVAQLAKRALYMALGKPVEKIGFRSQWALPEHDHFSADVIDAMESVGAAAGIPLDWPQMMEAFASILDRTQLQRLRSTIVEHGWTWPQ